MPKQKQVKTAYEDHKDKNAHTTETLDSIYTKEEIAYRDFIIDRLIFARDQRDQAHDLFDGQTYPQWYEGNTKASVSFVPPRKNKDEVNIVTGVTREKKLSVMSSVLNLNFVGEVHAYDTDNLEDVQVGSAMGDMVKKSEEIEDWNEETKLLAYDELTSQGNVFVEDMHIVETKWDKKKVNLEKFTEETFKTFKPEKKIKEVFRGCRRTVIPGIFMYLGNVKEFTIEAQPYLFTVEVIPWEEAKSLYGAWPRWEDVPKKVTKLAGDDQEEDSYGTDYSITHTVPEGWVEVIKYQDKWNDEYQIFLNATMMLPAEFPMPWESGEYSIIKGNLEPLSPIFAYCKGIPSKTKVDQQVYDEMYRLAIMKTHKSFLPPIANYSTNILNTSAFYAGKVHNDLQKGDIEVVGGDPSLYTLKASELSMIEFIKRTIDEKSIDPIAQGDTPEGDPTATEIREVQKQARINLGLIVLGFMAMHKKLTMLRIHNGLEHWTKPIGSKLDKTRGYIVNKYETFALETDIDGEGIGDRVIEITDEPDSIASLLDREAGIDRDEAGNISNRNKPRRPKRVVQVNPKALRAIKYTWFVRIVTEEKENTELQKILFEDSVTRAANLFGLESLNTDFLKQKWAILNHVPPSKFFRPGVNSLPPSQLTQQDNSVEQQVKPSKPGAEQLQETNA